MSRLLTAFLIAITITAIAPLPPAAAAVTTTSVACVTAHWSDLGAGPMTIQTTGPGCLVQIADADPTTATKVGFHLTAGAPFIYAGSSHLWVYGTGYAVVGK